jgi:class 3 adenylate cyclase
MMATVEGRRPVWIALVLVGVLYAAAVVLAIVGRTYESAVGSWGSTGWIGAFLVPATTFAFPVVGALITLRRPRNLIGWLLIGIGLVWGILGTVDGYSHYGAAHARSGLPGWDVALAISNAGWVPGIGLMIFVVLLFPNGRLPSPRWRPVALLIGLTLAIVFASILFSTQNFAESGYPEVSNPLRIEAIAPLLAELQIALALLPLSMLAAAASIAVRYRRAAGVERLQLKWLTAAGAVLAVAFTIAVLTPSGPEGQAVSLAAEIAQDISFATSGLIPIAIGIATLRYRLYDIDLIVNRTLVYGGATAVLAAAFAVANVASQRALESIAGQRSDLLTAALAVGAAFGIGPVRRWIRPIVDRFLPARAELALLFTDIVGSTQRAAKIGDERWRDLLGRYRAAVRRELNRFGGREIDTAGDGFFVTFDRPAAAVHCAWAMQAPMRDLGLELRTGIHVGECEMRGEKVSGLAVHTAARVMAAAGAGEILVSDAVSERLGGLDLRLTDHGVHELKGIPGEWHMYRVDGLATANG